VLKVLRRKAMASSPRAVLREGPPTAKEVGFLGGGLTCLGGLAYGSHLADGGLYVDDRWFHAFYDLAPDYFSGVEAILDSGEYGFRPLQAAQMAAMYGLFGTDAVPHLAWALLLAIASALSFYGLIRTLGMESLHAAAIASLALISPAADSTKLWAAAGHNNMAVALYFAGTTASLRAFGLAGRRGLLLHGTGLVLYVASLLLYETAAVAMLGSIILYRLKVPWRRAVTRWLADVLAVGITLSVDAVMTDRAAAGISQQLKLAELVARDGVSLVLSAGIPFGSKALVLAALGLGVIGSIAAVIPGRWRPDADVRTQIRRWVMVGGLAGLGVLAAYAMLLPSGYLRPLAEGGNNRSNILAVFPVVTLIYAVVMVAGVLAVRFLARWREAAAVFPIAVALVVGIAYLDEVRQDKADWASAAVVQRVELERLEVALPRIPPGGTVYSVRNRQSVAPGFPGLVWWDLYGAGWLTWGPSVNAVLVPPGTRWRCGSKGVAPDLDYVLADRTYRTAGTYGRSHVVDVRQASAAKLDDVADCRRLAAKAP
jgi:hypothetical protein